MEIDFSSQLLERLQTQQLVDQNQVTQLLQQYNQNAGQVLRVLIEQNVINPIDLAQIKSQLLNIQYVDLAATQIDPAVLQRIPYESASTYQCVPFQENDGIVNVALVNPEEYNAIEALDYIARQQQLKFAYYCTSPASVEYVLRQYAMLQSAPTELSPDVNTLSPTPPTEATPALPVQEDYTELIKTAPVSKIVAVILKHAVEGEASDVHIEPVKEETRIRYRVDGVLHTSLVLPMKLHQAVVARIKVMANLKLDETRLPQDGRFKMKFDDHEVEFRVSTLPLLDREKVVLRILDTAASIVSLEDLGFEDSNLLRIQKHIKQPHGMVLITGPTGSGKSTTLYSILSLLNKEDVNIITLEDPVEYNLTGIAQSQMKPEIGLSFANGLRSVLRQDPDIIMVGEIRDQETAELAVHAALTGHMLLSSLHTNDSFGAVPRLIDMGIEPFLLASSLNLIIAQRLVRKICESCKVAVQVDQGRQAEIMAEISQMPSRYLPQNVRLLPPFTVYQGKGCDRCDHTGYHGRRVISEILENTEEFSKMIGEEKTLGDAKLVQAEIARQGMFTMRQDGLIKVLRGQTSLEEVWNATKE